MNAVLTLSSKNQLTLPVSVTNLLGLIKGSKLWTKVVGNSIVIEKVPSWDELQSSIKDTYLTKDKTTLEIIELARKLEGKRLAKKYGL